MQLLPQQVGTHLFARRHAFHLLAQCPPVLRLELCVLDAFLTPVLMQSADVELALLEIEKLIADALLDEDSACMLLNDAFLVL